MEEKLGSSKFYHRYHTITVQKNDFSIFVRGSAPRIFARIWILVRADPRGVDPRGSASAVPPLMSTPITDVTSMRGDVGF